MPMKPMSPESLKGLAQASSAKARLLDDDEVDALTAEAEEEEDDEQQDGPEGEQ